MPVDYQIRVSKSNSKLSSIARATAGVVARIVATARAIVVSKGLQRHSEAVILIPRVGSH